MLKLIVLSAIFVCVWGAVLPKPPTAPEQKSDSPAVKEVPLRGDSKQPAEDIHKPSEQLEKAKPAESGKPEPKSAQKEQHSAQKAEEQGHRDNVKQGRRENVKQNTPHNMHSKAKPVEEKKPAENAKAPLKTQAEETKVKPSEKGR